MSQPANQIAGFLNKLNLQNKFFRDSVHVDTISQKLKFDW